MKSTRLKRSMISAEITGAEPEKTLYHLNRAGVQMYQICWVDDLTVRFHCPRKDRRNIQSLCDRTGDSVSFGTNAADTWKNTVRKRPILAAGIGILLLLTLFLPTRVLFFRVEGNERLPVRQILEEAAECGIRFGVSRRAVRSEKMKNALLEAMPELKWAGINTSGCTAVISVREREPEQKQASSDRITGIVAAADGYITSGTVVRGTGLFAPGQIVREGQLLISGYADHGICISITGAEGEIIAQTNRKLESIAPLQCLQRVGEERQIRRFSLLLGKNRINFWKDSRIWDATCGRMYEEYYLTLPGGFRLPIALAVDTFICCETVASAWPAQYMGAALKAHTQKTVLEQTIAGSILREEHTITQNQSTVCISSRFLCSEMIGRGMTEEIGDTHGKTD